MWKLVLFVLVLSVVLVRMGIYVEKRLLFLIKIEKPTKKKVRIFWLVTLCLWFVSRFWGEYFPYNSGRMVGMVSGAIGLFIILAAILLLVVDIARWLSRVVMKMMTKVRPSRIESARIDSEGATRFPTTESHMGISRRGFLVKSSQGAALTLAGGTSLYGTIFGRTDYTIEEVPVPIEGLSTTLDGYTIVQISDIHFGTWIGEATIKAAVSLIKEAKPDLIVITGDLIDIDAKFSTYAGVLIRALEGVARDGISVIPGNHDYYAGVEQVLSTVQKAGGTVLKNHGKVIGDTKQGFSLLGVDDVWAERLGNSQGPDIAAALKSVPHHLPKILLCHNPSYFPKAHQQVQLQLSGHTHGGQINLFIKPANFVLPYGYVDGMYKRDQSYLYVNRGFGTVGPMARVGAPPEITKVILVAA